MEPQIQPSVSMLSYFGKDRDVIPVREKQEVDESVVGGADDS